MAIIRPAAENAAAMAAQQEAAAAAAERDALVSDARLRVEALPAPDGKLPLSGKGKDLQAVHVDLDHGLVVLSDGDTAVAVRSDGSSSVVVVENVDDGWVACSEPVTNLAELGRALEA